MEQGSEWCPSEWEGAAGEEEAALLSASITDEQLQVLAGSTDLESVKFLQMTVDSVRAPQRGGGACAGRGRRGA